MKGQETSRRRTQDLGRAPKPTVEELIAALPVRLSRCYYLLGIQPDRDNPEAAGRLYLCCRDHNVSYHGGDPKEVPGVRYWHTIAGVQRHVAKMKREGSEWQYAVLPWPL